MSTPSLVTTLALLMSLAGPAIAKETFLPAERAAPDTAQDRNPGTGRPQADLELAEGPADPSPPESASTESEPAQPTADLQNVLPPSGPAPTIDGATCEAEKAALAGQIASTIRSYENTVAEISALRSAVEQERDDCRAEERLNLSTNVALNRRVERLTAELEALSSRTPPVNNDPLDGPVAQDAAQTTQLDDAEKVHAALRTDLASVTADRDEARDRIAQLEARLRELGFSAEPTFAYRGDVHASFAQRSVAAAIPERDRLAVDRCADALAWLRTQTGSERPLRPIVWAFDESSLLLCQMGRDGTTLIPMPAERASDEAHIILYR